MIKPCKSQPARNQIIDSKCVHIWLASLIENEKDVLLYQSVLSQQELVRTSNYKFSKDQSCYILSRGILRCLLSRYLEQKPQDINILCSPWGKPHLLQDFHLYFNVSHSKDYVIYAFSSKYEVGIDIEYIDPTIDIDCIIPSILSSPQEFTYWQTIKEKEKINSFFKLWVCKEAYLKACGKGWLDKKHHLPIQTIERLQKEQKGNSSNHKMNPYIFEVVPGYTAALFVKGSDNAVPLHYTWNSEIMNRQKQIISKCWDSLWKPL